MRLLREFIACINLHSTLDKVSPKAHDMGQYLYKQVIDKAWQKLSPLAEQVATDLMHIYKQVKAKAKPRCLEVGFTGL